MHNFSYQNYSNDGNCFNKMQAGMCMKQFAGPDSGCFSFTLRFVVRSARKAWAQDYLP